MKDCRANPMAHRTTLEAEGPSKTPKAAKKAGAASDNRASIFDAFRRWGYLEARLDPLGLFEPLKYPDLEALAGESAAEARGYYCGAIGAEFMHLLEPEPRRWIAERLEAAAPET